MMANRIATATLLAALAVAGCTSSGGTQVESTLNTPQASQPAAESTPATGNALAESPQPSAAETVTNNQLATASPTVADPSRSLTFLPVQGAPQDKVSLLSKSLKQSAATYQLNLVPQTQTGAAYQVKGYFSALSDGSGTLLVYIWDVLDRSGKRVHRINGQERASGLKADPWQAITASELSRIANSSAQRLKSWVDANPAG